MLKSCNPFTSETFDAEAKAKNLKGKRVIITTVKGAKYAGILSGYDLNKATLSKMVGLQKNGNYKFLSGNQDLNFRRFNITSLAYIDLETSQDKPYKEEISKALQENPDLAKLLADGQHEWKKCPHCCRVFVGWKHHDSQCAEC